ncbi:transcription factor S-II central domain-containing protein [Babesia ovis]|uniref:Transcription factor S-II central domain-containing protein n=1 Tax=Babesia ovis TaxID=5869 RepID=A0A9W5WWD2_BABOV|nr:transcription factor S-II central domain-containing protein [Babesia ovis]
MTGNKRARNREGSRKNGKKNVDPDKVHIRSTYGRKLIECLMRGLEEVKKDEPEFSMTEDDIQNLTNNICDICHDYYGYDRRGFRQRIFDIYVNLKRENNYDLRRKIITKAMTVHDLVHADTLQLAPDHLQHKRQMEVEKHYLRNVILPNEKRDEVPTGAIGTPQQHRGEDAVIDVGVDNSKSKSFMDLDISVNTENHEVNSLFDNESSNSSESESGSDEVEMDDQDTPNNYNHVDASNPDEFEDVCEGKNVKRLRMSPSAKTNEATDKDANNATGERTNDTIIELNSGILIAKQQKIESENEESPRLPPLPDGSHITLERVMERIEKRLELLPPYIAKPFRVPLRCGHKRVTLLMARSHILQNRRPDNKRG